MPLLNPHKKELKKKYWKSLKDEPEGMPFAFQYDANECKKKKPRDDDEGEQDAAASHTEGPVSAHVTISTNTAPPYMDAVMLKQMGDIAAEAAAKKVKDLVDEMLQQYHKKFVRDVEEYVVNRLLKRASDSDYRLTDLSSTLIGTQLNMQQPTNTVTSVEAAAATTLTAMATRSAAELVPMESTEAAPGGVANAEATKERKAGAMGAETTTTPETTTGETPTTTSPEARLVGRDIDLPASDVEQV